MQKLIGGKRYTYTSYNLIFIYIINFGLFRLITSISHTVSMFSSFPSNSAYGKVLSNNMDDYSYINNENGISHELLSKSKTAAFEPLNSMRTQKDYKNCKVIMTSMPKF